MYNKYKCFPYLPREVNEHVCRWGNNYIPIYVIYTCEKRERDLRKTEMLETDENANTIESLLIVY